MGLQAPEPENIQRGGKRGGLVLYCAGAEVAFLLPLIMSVPPSANSRKTFRNGRLNKKFRFDT
jgi:hypothetical protein